MKKVKLEKRGTGKVSKVAKGDSSNNTRLLCPQPHGVTEGGKLTGQTSTTLILTCRYSAHTQVKEGRKTKARMGESDMVCRRKKHGRKEPLKIKILNSHPLSTSLCITYKLERKLVRS